MIAFFNKGWTTIIKFSSNSTYHGEQAITRGTKKCH